MAKNKNSRAKSAGEFLVNQGKAASNAAKMLGNGVDIVNGASALINGKPITGALGIGKGVVNGAINAGKAMYNSGKSVVDLAKTIFNDKYWWERLGKVTPAMNTNRPMNPIMNTSISKDPTMGSVVKVIDFYVLWKDLANSEAFDTIVFKYYEQIRNDLRSNLPYTLQEVKEYLIDSIAIHILGVSLKKLLEFRTFTIPHSPNSYQLFRRYSSTPGGYGVGSLNEFEWLNDDKIAESIAAYDIAVDIHNNLARIPQSLAEFIDHYFGLVFQTDIDNSNSQFINPLLYECEYYDEDDTLQTLSIFDITPSKYLDLLNKFAVKFGMVAADILKSQSGLTVGYLPKYSDLQATTYYDETFLQALCNAYTDSNSLQGDYIRLDVFPNSSDYLTTFLFLGQLQQSISDIGFLNLPLLIPKGMTLKIENTPDLEWENGFDQGANFDYENTKYFGIQVASTIFADFYASIGTTNKVYLSDVNQFNNSNSGTAINVKLNSTGGSGLGKVTLGTINKLTSLTGTGYAYMPIIKIHRQSAGFPIVASDDDIYICSEFTFNSVSAGPFSNAYNVTFTSTGKFKVLDGFKSMVLELNSYLLLSASALSTEPAIKQGELPSIGGNTIKIDMVTMSALMSADNGILNASLNSGFSIPTSSAYFQVTKAVPDKQFIFITTAYQTVISITDKWITATSDNVSAGQVSGYTGLVAWIVDQVDQHIPIKSIVRGHIEVNNTEVSNVTYCQDLIKESYIPFFYNIKDLLPVAYQMMNSLLSPNSYTRVYNSNSRSKSKH